MMGDPNIREGFVQRSLAKVSRQPVPTANGAMAGYIGMGMGIQGAGGFMNAASNTNMQQMQQQAQYQQMMNQQQAQQMQQTQYGQPQGGQQPVRRHLDLYLRSSQYRKLLPELRRPPSGSSRLDLYLRSSQHRKILSELRETTPVKEGVYVSSQL